MLFTTSGAIWGSFVGALCSRWPKGESVTNGRSQCENCDNIIAFYDLIPILSFLLLRGKCRACQHSIGADTFAVEIASGLIGFVAIVSFPPAEALAIALFGWCLLPLAILDYRHFWLPDRLLLALASVALLAGPLLTPDISWTDRVIGAGVGFACLESVRLIFLRIRQHEGMGAGDPKLFAAIGIWLGWEALPVVLLIATMLGLAFVVAGRLLSRKSSPALPFGVYLAAASLMACWITWLPN